MTAWAAVRKDITPYYRALGLSPGAEPLEIRRAYRMMVQQWHPDLYKPGSPMQTTAEDITKEINEAYDQLYRKKLYRNFSPTKDRDAVPEVKTRKAPTETATKTEKGAKQKKAGGSSKRPPQKGPAPGVSWGNRMRGLRCAIGMEVAAALCVAAGLLPFSRVLVDPSSFVSRGDLPSRGGAHPEESSQPKAVTRTTQTARPAVGVGSAEAGAPDSPGAPSGGDRSELRRDDVLSPRYLSLQQISSGEPDKAVLLARAATLLDVIELGNTKARVIEIQGAPDEAGNDIFRYGSSVVYFRNGLVHGWLDRYPRLHIRDWCEEVLPRLDTFSLGSTRGDVIQAQGQPDAFTSTSYSFGSSVVFFDKDLVSGWGEGDVRLQRFAMPSLPFVDLDHVEVWSPPLEF